MIPKAETITWSGPRVAVKAAKPPVQMAASVTTTMFKMRADPSGRMAGSVPVWGQAETPEDKIVSSIAEAAQPTKSGPEFATALNATTPAPPKPDAEFGFGDLVDMVNPLHHIPLVGTVYRNMTGDEIKPISRILGGAVFGGAIGAAAGLANTIVAAETGKDIGDSMVAFVRPDKPQGKTDTATTLAQNTAATTGLSAGEAADEARFAAILDGATAARRKPSISAKTDVALTLFAQNQSPFLPPPAQVAAAYQAPRYNS